MLSPRTAALGHVPRCCLVAFGQPGAALRSPSSPPLAIKIPGFALRSAAIMTRLETLPLGSVLPSIISTARHLPPRAVLDEAASSLGCQLRALLTLFNLQPARSSCFRSEPARLLRSSALGALPKQVNEGTGFWGFALPQPEPQTGHLTLWQRWRCHRTGDGAAAEPCSTRTDPGRGAAGPSGLRLSSERGRSSRSTFGDVLPLTGSQMLPSARSPALRAAFGAAARSP